MWKAIRGLFKGHRTTQVLALSGIDAVSVKTLSDDELTGLEGLCHELIAENPVDDAGLPVLVATERGIGVNPSLQSMPWGFRLLVTPEGITAAKESDRNASSGND